MATNYLIYPYASEASPDWETRKAGLINQPAVNIGEITTAYLSDNWTINGSAFTPFQVSLMSNVTTSNWVIAKYTFSDLSTTGFTHLTNVHNDIVSAVSTAGQTKIQNHHAHNTFTTYQGVSVEFTHASYNWSVVDTTGYTYTNGFPPTSTTGESGENPDTTYGLEYTSNYDRDTNTWSKVFEDVADTGTDDATFTYTPTSPHVNIFSPNNYFDQNRKLISIYNPDGTPAEEIDTTETEINYVGIGKIGRAIIDSPTAQTLSLQYSQNPNYYMNYLNDPNGFAVDTYLLTDVNIKYFIKAIIEESKINKSDLVKNIQKQMLEKGQ